MQDAEDTTPCEESRSPSSRGRPRDPGLEPRVLDAALTLYSEQGWVGFNFDVVARSAGVGKAAIYRRWRSRAELLADAMNQRWQGVGTIDGGSLRDDLMALARIVFDVFAGPYGGVALHLRSDARRFPEVKAFEEQYREKLVHQGRNIVRRAIARRDIPESVSPTFVMDVVVGSIVNHVISTPQRLHREMLEKSDAFILALVEFVVTGLAVPNSPPGNDSETA